MIQNFQLKGFWFLPSKENERIAGILYFDTKKGIKLELIGCLKRESNLELIWGILENGQSITLYKNFETQRQVNLPGYEISHYTSLYLFIGAWFTSKKDISFNSISIHYSYIDEWLNINGFKKIEVNNEERKFSMEYELPKRIEIPINPNTKFCINLITKGPTLLSVQNEFVLRQKAFIDFIHKRKESLENVLQNSFQFQNFLTLLLQRPTFPKEIIGQIKIMGQEAPLKVKIYFQVNFINEEEKILHSMDMLVPYKKIESRFPLIIQTWYLNRAKLEPATDPFFATYYNPNLYISDKFLNLMRSIEAFHKNTINTSRVQNRVRVTEIFVRFSRVFNSTLQIRSQVKLIDTLITYRNAFTHSNPITQKLKIYVILYHICLKLQVIMSCALLHEHLLTKREIKECIDQSRLYTHLRHKL